MAIGLYARKSIERESSISCDTQLEYCKSMIKPDERNEKVYKFIDNGFSGGNTERDDFQKMMKMVRKGKLNKVIVYRLDRISRSLSDFTGILQVFKEHDVQFVSSQETFDTSSPYGEMIIKILMVFAEFERQSIIERVKQAYDHRSKMGLYMGGRKPYGFTLEDTAIRGIKTKMFVPDSIEAEHIKYIFNSYAVENISLRRLMGNLIANNILPKSGEWSAAKLSNILKNPIYVRADNDVYNYFKQNDTNIISNVRDFDGIHGLQIYGKSKHDAGSDWSDIKAVVMTHEGLIPSDIWLKCQKKLEKNKQMGKSMSNTTSWIGGKIVCKQCRRKMTVTRGGKRRDGTQVRYFNCTDKSHNRICKGTKATIYADSLENIVYELISRKLNIFSGCRKKVSADNSNRMNLLKNRLSEIEISQEQIVSIILNEEVGAQMLKILNEKAQKLSYEKRELHEKLETLENKEGEAVNITNLSAKWKSAAYEERQAVCDVLIHEILIHQDGTVEVVWKI